MHNIDWNPVESSNIQALAYDGVFMYVRFLSGGIYRYGNVPESVYQELLNAESVGGSFHRLIKKNPDKYPYQKLNLESA